MRVFLLCWLLSGAAAWAEPPAGVWEETETYGAALRGSWNFSPATRTFQARWDNGSNALLRLEQYDDRHIVITRADSNGLNARYEGVRGPQGYTGQVTWTWLDQARRGTWSVQFPSP